MSKRVMVNVKSGRNDGFTRDDQQIFIVLLCNCCDRLNESFPLISLLI